MTMKHGPNLNDISSAIFSWRKGIITFEEVKARLVRAMNPANYVPEGEQSPEPLPGEPSPREYCLRRVEVKVNLIAEHLGITLPDDINPKVLSEEVVEVLREQGKIAAIALHCSRTGARLAEAKAVVDQHLSKRQ